MIQMPIIYFKAIQPVSATGQQQWTTPGIYQWLCPADVYAVCAITVGGGANGQSVATYANGGNGGNYGGGAGGAIYDPGTVNGTGAPGAVRLIWGPGRAFPSTLTGNL